MVDIITLMYACRNYTQSQDYSSWVSEKINCNEDDTWVIVPENYFAPSLHNSLVNKENIKYNIEAMFQLRNIFINAKMDMMVLHLTKAKVNTIRVSLFLGKTINLHRDKYENKDEVYVSLDFTKEYHAYIKKIQNWTKDGAIPRNDKKSEFKIVDETNFDNRHLFPNFYKDKALEVRRFINPEKIVILDSVADIIRPHKRKGKGKIFSFKYFKFPSNVNYVEEKHISDVLLQRGDIVISPSNIFKKIFLYTESEENVYASPNTYVIRCTNILPEYLYLYMSSETGRTIFDTYNLDLPIKKISFLELKKFPIIRSSLNSYKYVNYFNTISSTDNRFYYLGQGFHEYRTNAKEPKSIEDILSIELANTIRIHNTTQLRAFITEDLKELNTCFRGGAFKATLILAGSILEAVLIDWLSEIKGVNYFKNDYMVIDGKGSKKAQLINYIDTIKNIESPKWNSEAVKAHEIRMKRNLVHAKLCIKSNDVNETVCRKVIGNLKDILKTRGIQKKS